jgi:Arc/MetJ-type ribon-helix-helix transcriptional regulator
MRNDTEQPVNDCQPLKMNDLPTGLPVQICNRRKTIMRTTVNISFPDDLYLFIRDRVDAGAYASVSEYMRALVREDRSRGSDPKPKRRKTPAVRRANEVMAEYRAGHDEC